MNQRKFCLELGADYGCFTRPELRVERYSYDVITPSAARACFEAIFWKPRFFWTIERIEVLSPIKFIPATRNELIDFSYPVCINEKRTIRSAMILHRPRYRIHATMQLNDDLCYFKHGERHLLEDRGETIDKFAEIFKRRMEKGQFRHIPYFGLREFSVNHMTLIEDIETARKERPPIDETRPLGIMLYGIDYGDGRPESVKPLFFNALMNHGVIEVPPRSEVSQ